MKLNLFKSTAVLFLIGAIVSSCGKYEEGPGLSLRSKTKRLVGAYNVDKFEVDGQPDLDPNEQYEFEFLENETLNITEIYDGESYTETATWKFDDDKEFLEFNFDGDAEKWEIIRLSNKEVWIEKTETGSNGVVFVVYIEMTKK